MMEVDQSFLAGESDAMAGSRLPLSTIAHGRSGDKGNHANVAVIAYTTAGFAWMREHLTANVVGGYFASLQPSRVDRYEAASLLALNFVLHDVLAGGASRSLRVDSQGKTLALALLQMPIEPPPNHADMLRRVGEGS
jgi:hypothetical protein